MKYYFFSPIRSMLAVNGTHAAAIGKNVFKTEAGDNALFELFSPPEFLPCFAISSKKAFDRNFDRLRYYDGELFVPVFVRAATPSVSAVFERYVSINGTEYVVNAHIDGFLRLSVYSSEDRVTANMALLPTEVEVSKRDDHIIVICKSRVEEIFVFSVSPLKCVFSAVCDGHSLSDVLTVSQRKRGVSEYVCRSHFGFRGGFSLLGKDLLSSDRPSDFSRSVLLSQFFLETAIYGGDVTPFLCAELRNSANNIVSFIGNAAMILPPCERLYPDLFSIVSDSVKYCKIFFENGKIRDIDVRCDPF